MARPCTPNPSRILGQGLDAKNLRDRWIPGPTAILVVHGIGSQQPLETLDQFTRTLVETYRDLGVPLELSHGVAKRRSPDGEVWLESFVRLRRAGSPHHLDVYEYYWANLTEDRATAADVQSWVVRTARGAEKFYEDQAALGQAYCDRSFFFRRKDGAFRAWRYRLVLSLLARIAPAALRGWSGLLSLAARLPIVRGLLGGTLEAVQEATRYSLVNVLGDVIVYNTTDAKSKFYRVRKAILDGAVDALRRLVEPEGDGPWNEGAWAYDRVVLAGHSLGSQVAFDALNRLNQLIGQEEIKGFDRNGLAVSVPGGRPAARPRRITDVLGGLVTFGSPLDKMAFFLRDHVEPDQYLRRQILDGLHGFKQRDWSPNGQYPAKLQPLHPRLLDEVPWLNYFDGRDYVSGSLDYYEKLTNVDCRFGSGLFTHSRYWQCQTLYREVMNELLHRAPLRPVEVSRPDRESAVAVLVPAPSSLAA